MKQEFSVLMSIYYKEKPKYFTQCMESILNQTILPNEIIIVKDGPLTKELNELIDKYVSMNPKMYNIVVLQKNLGLGLALAEGVKACSNELIARMDTDDIARNDRFEIQIKEFQEDPDLDICGSQIQEFYEDINKVTGIRKVPLEDEDIKKYQRRRDGFNHMTVMYKKSKVLAAGNYQDALLMEDSLLWVNMIQSGVKCKNIDDCLVYVRANAEMYKRRGGITYLKKYKMGRKKIRDTGYISWWDYYYTLIIQFIVAVAPRSIRKIVFTKLLRKKGDYI